MRFYAPEADKHQESTGTNAESTSMPLFASFARCPPSKPPWRSVALATAAAPSIR
jgi:hypothetical protein